MNVLKQEKLYTIDDIYALPDGERAELIDGHGTAKLQTSATGNGAIRYIKRLYKIPEWEL